MMIVIMVKPKTKTFWFFWKQPYSFHMKFIFIRFIWIKFIFFWGDLFLLILQNAVYWDHEIRKCGEARTPRF